MKTVIIVGSGPCGLLMAHYLLQRDRKYRIELYDNRADPRTPPISTARSYSISLGFRGRAALREVGLESLVIQRGILALGQQIHNAHGVMQAIPRKTPRLFIERHVLTQLLLETLSERYDATRLELHFHQKCVDIDLEAKLACFESASGAKQCKTYNLLIGADGVHSTVRAILQRLTGLEVRTRKSPVEFKTLTLCSPDNCPDLKLNNNSIHLYCLGFAGSLLLMPKPDGTYSSLVSFIRGNNPLVNQSLGTKILEFFSRYMGNYRQLISSEEAESFAQKPFFQTTTVQCSHYHCRDRVLLVGDAAHAISPIIGQGCSAALEDSLVFNHLLNEYNDDLTQAVPQYTVRRRPDMVALEQMSDNFIPLNVPLALATLLKHVFDRLLHRWFPKRWAPSPIDMLTESTIPYRQILYCHFYWIKLMGICNRFIIWIQQTSFPFKIIPKPSYLIK